MITGTIVFNVCVGVGLSAACGFRVFVPLLVLSIASKMGYLTLGPGFQWLSSYHAITILSAATVVEIIGFLFPVVDNALDVIAAPLAVIAGTVITASVVTDMEPVFRWALAIIAGGGVAAAGHTVTSVIRGGSTTTTGGLANPLFAAAESVMAVFASIAAIFIPVVVVILFFLSLLFFGKKIYKRFSKHQPA